MVSVMDRQDKYMLYRIARSELTEVTRNLIYSCCTTRALDLYFLSSPLITSIAADDST